MPEPILQDECWKTVPGFPDYEIDRKTSTIRRVAYAGRPSARLPKVVKQTPHRGGAARLPYLRVVLFRENGKPKMHMVNRLMLLTFVGEPPTSKHQAAHGDGNCQNNSLSNLRWATPQENMDDQLLHGTRLRGERCWSSKLTREDVLVIKAALARKRVGDIRKLAKVFGVGENAIDRINRGSRWKHITPTVVRQVTDDKRKVLMAGQLFTFAERAPFLSSGESIGGAIEYDEEHDQLRCHECGKWFTDIGTHLRHRHDLSAREYKIKHGLLLKTSLRSRKRGKDLSALAKRLVMSGAFGRPAMETRALAVKKSVQYRSDRSPKRVPRAPQ